MLLLAPAAAVRGALPVHHDAGRGGAAKAGGRQGGGGLQATDYFLQLKAVICFKKFC